MGELARWNTVGGSAITMDANLSSHMVKQGYGKEKTGLGRWSWVRVRGCDDIFTRFISAYRPCKNTSSIMGCWGQHVNYFRKELDIRLGEEISAYKNIVKQNTKKKSGDLLSVSDRKKIAEKMQKM